MGFYGVVAIFNVDFDLMIKSSKVFNKFKQALIL